MTQGIARKALDTEFEKANEQISSSKPRGGRNATLRRLSLLWAPAARKSVNVAIVRSDGTLADDDDEKAEELAKFWGNTVAEKQVDEVDASNFLLEFGADFAFKSMKRSSKASSNALATRLQVLMVSPTVPGGPPYRLERASFSEFCRS